MWVRENRHSQSPVLMPHQWQKGNAQNWKIEGAMFKSRSSLLTKPFGVFRSFLRNSHKYGLGFLRKTSTECAPPILLGT